MVRKPFSFPKGSKVFSILFAYPLVLLAMAFVLTAGTSAQTNNSLSVSKSDFDQLEKAYTEAAFKGHYVQLTKFNSVTPLTSSFECASSVTDKCLATTALFKYSFLGSERIWVERTKGKSDLRLIVADRDRLADLRAKYEKLHRDAGEVYRYGTMDNTSADCQVYVWVLGSMIVHAVTIISVDAEPLRAQTCFIVNFARSLGLTPNGKGSFADTWGDADHPRAGLTPAYYEKLRHKMNVLMHIHACKRLQLGMIKEEVELELTPESECLNGLM